MVLRAGGAPYEVIVLVQLPGRPVASADVPPLDAFVHLRERRGEYFVITTAIDKGEETLIECRQYGEDARGAAEYFRACFAALAGGGHAA